MVSVETYVIPSYTRDHFAYYMQVCEWYLDINHFKDELLSFHVDRSQHYQQWLSERGKGTVVTLKRELVEV
jgi:hypothetical protein